jgi:ABC-type phosphate transport system auxiliary subunit
MTDNEKKLLEQIYEKVNRIGDNLGELNGKETSNSVESKLDDVKSIHKKLQDTFTKGFADVNKGIDEINKNIKRIKKNGKQVH